MEKENEGTELRFTATCTQWFWNTYPTHRGRLRRIKNELDNHPYKTKKEIAIQLSENKATGIIAGDSDLYWIDFKMAYIELKLPGRTQSKEQIVYMHLLQSYGQDYYVIDNLNDFKKLIVNLLNGKR